ncbi:MAG: HigA family addiction module antitoxin [Nitrosopumilus sp.]
MGIIVFSDQHEFSPSLCRLLFPLGDKEMVNKTKIPPIHPGEILLEEFLKPMGITQYRLSKDINVPPRRINEIVQGKRAVSANTALRLGRYFKMSAQFWMNLQSHYDIELETDKISDNLEKEIQVCASMV